MAKRTAVLVVLFRIQHTIPRIALFFPRGEDWSFMQITGPFLGFCSPPEIVGKDPSFCSARRRNCTRQAGPSHFIPFLCLTAPFEEEAPGSTYPEFPGLLLLLGIWFAKFSSIDLNRDLHWYESTQNLTHSLVCMRKYPCSFKLN